MYRKVCIEYLIVRGQAFIYVHILHFGGLTMSFFGGGGCRIEARNKHGIQYTQKAMCFPPRMGSVLAVLFSVNELR
jgi:hypothetical protein